jgi:Acyl-CoA thioesterase C-terminal domain/Acyl-CoA thioesterase N-terminal domain
MANDPFFHQEGEAFVPTDDSRGPWNHDSLHGRVLLGLLGHALETQYGGAEFLSSRLTVDMFRLARWEPVMVSTRPIREGNRIKVVEGTLMSSGKEIARGVMTLLRRAEDPEGKVWGPEDWDVTPAAAIEPNPPPKAGWAPMWDSREITGRSFGGPDVKQKRVWIRENRVLVDEVPLTPFMRAALAADFTHPLANSGTKGLEFINADVTLYLHREPLDEWLGFEVLAHHSSQGIAVGECMLYDANGAFGRSIVCGVANKRG